MEWTAPVLCGGKPLAGTGMWRSAVTEGLCSTCFQLREADRRTRLFDAQSKQRLITLFGGIRPYREFTFERYRVATGNRVAFERTRRFDASRDNLYLWGACGVGKTHLACAAARRMVQAGRTVERLIAPELTRSLRMRPPDEESAGIDRLIRVEVFVLDDLGMGTETSYFRQVLQEVLDGRWSQDRAGLVVTSKYSLANLAEKMNDDTIPSRLAGVCQVIEITGPDHRVPLARMKR
jgi:DNA replication protein DnaC